jgi:trimethylamine:corrinoid methyltransferase-like protein
MMAEYLQPIEVNEDTIALDAILEAGAGGHFFGVEHTISRYETAFYHPILSDQRNFETWEEAGSVDTQARANGIWKQLLMSPGAKPDRPHEKGAGCRNIPPRSFAQGSLALVFSTLAGVYPLNGG